MTDSFDEFSQHMGHPLTAQRDRDAIVVRCQACGRTVLTITKAAQK